MTDGGLEIWRPTVAVDGQGKVCIAWSQHQDGNWDIYTRTYTPGKDNGEGTFRM